MVIRPVPARLHQHANITLHSNSTVNMTTDGVDGDGQEASDDEMFLDADGELSSEVAIDTGLPIRRRNNTKDKDEDKEEVVLQSQKHIVFKRKDPEEDTMSDYGILLFGMW